MRIKKKRVKTQKRYDPAMKRSIAKSYLAGEASYSVLASENGLKNKDVVKEFVKWYRRILASEQICNPMNDDEKEIEIAIDDLSKEELLTLLKKERQAKKTAELRAEFYETMVEIAEKELGVDIKKNSGTKR